MGAIQTETLTSGVHLIASGSLLEHQCDHNFIADAGRSAVWLGNTIGGSMTGNYILAPNARPDLGKRESRKARRRDPAARRR